jgi:Family of unknown function (DUF6866) C-terminal domain/Family of unknown function (DUF6866) N-terminal domain
MLNFGELVTAVQRNCHISDARHAGDFTLCIYLLKMRELYRWENDLPLTDTLPTGEVGSWLQERERLWDGLESRPFLPLPLERGAHDPFDSIAANRELVPQGYVYSAGYGRLNKPHFFLASLANHEQRGGYTVYVSACEYARDLEAPPAMLQGRTIFVRRESVRRFLWEKIEERRWNRDNSAMNRALDAYGFESPAAGSACPTTGLPELNTALDFMTQVETESMILHELGEGLAGEKLGPDWETMLAGFPRSKTEIAARAVRDLLADCLSTLPVLLERENRASLHFYFANFTGMRRHLFPEAMRAYRAWTERDNDPDVLGRLAAEGAARWLAVAQEMLALHRRLGIDAAGAIDALIDRTSACAGSDAGNNRA